MTLGIWSKNVVSRVITKIKKKLGKVNLRKGANLCLLLQPPEEFLGPLNGPRGLFLNNKKSLVLILKLIVCARL